MIFYAGEYTWFLVNVLNQQFHNMFCHGRFAQALEAQVANTEGKSI